MSPSTADAHRQTLPTRVRCVSRVDAGSVTLVTPSAWSPASSTALFTWALGVGDWIARSAQAGAVNRQRRVAVDGLETRAHPLERLDDAPHRPAGERGVTDERARKGVPARTPDRSLIVVPELPASSGPAGERSCPKPRPSKVTVPAGPSAIDTPSRCRQIQGRPAVGAGRKIVQQGRAVGERREQAHSGAQSTCRRAPSGGRGACGPALTVAADERDIWGWILRDRWYSWAS